MTESPAAIVRKEKAAAEVEIANAINSALSLFNSRTGFGVDYVSVSLMDVTAYDSEWPEKIVDTIEVTIERV